MTTQSNIQTASPEALGKVIATGSSGNALLYFGCVLVDAGVSYKVLKPYVHLIQLVLLTHAHGDHFNPRTIRTLHRNRPAVRFACPPHMESTLIVEGISERNIDCIPFGAWYTYSPYLKVACGKLYHDVPNAFWRIWYRGRKVFHATDTSTLEGISAKGYQLYAIEANFREQDLVRGVLEAESKGEYAHGRRSIDTHLSREEMQDFILRNAKGAFGKDYHVLHLHESSTYSG